MPEDFPPEINPFRDFESKSMRAKDRKQTPLDIQYARDMTEKVTELSHLRNLLNALGGMMVVDDINRRVVISYLDLNSTPQTEKLLRRLREIKASGESLSKE